MIVPYEHSLKMVVAYHHFDVDDSVGGRVLEVNPGEFLIVCEPKDPYEGNTFHADGQPGWYTVMWRGKRVYVHESDYISSCHEVDDVPDDHWEHLVS